MNKNIQIYFTNYEPQAKFSLEKIISSNEGFLILITPLNDGWNDFGHHVRCKLELKTNNDNYFERIIFLGIENFKNDNNVQIENEFIGLSEYLNKHKINENLVQIDNLEKLKFFIMFQDIQDYVDLCRIFGLTDTNRMLSKLNDIVYLKSTNTNTSLLNKFLDSEMFSSAFMRETKSFYTFHNADYVLSGLDINETSQISTNLKLNYSLIGKKNENKIDFEFDMNSILPKRINALIGKNRLGKSRALNSIVNSMMKNKKVFQTTDRKAPIFNNLIAMGTPGETGSTFPNVLKSSKIRYKRLIIGRHSQSKRSFSVGDLISQLFRSDQYIGDFERWELFIKSIASIGINSPIIVKLNEAPSKKSRSCIYIEGDVYTNLTKLENENEQVLLIILGSIAKQSRLKTYIDGKAIPLSSGQSSFLKFAAQACLFIENGTLVLLDEPETHMHPNYISEFIALLDNILKQTRSIAILATHSVYIVREIPRRQVNVFLEDSDGNINITNPRLNTIGSNISSISFFVFGDTNRSNVINRIIKKAKEASITKEFLLNDFDDELSNESLMYIERVWEEI